MNFVKNNVNINRTILKKFNFILKIFEKKNIEKKFEFRDFCFIYEKYNRYHLTKTFLIVFEFIKIYC